MNLADCQMIEREPDLIGAGHRLGCQHLLRMIGEEENNLKEAMIQNAKAAQAHLNKFISARFEMNQTQWITHNRAWARSLHDWHFQTTRL